MLQCNCHVVGDPVTHEAIVIDPGDDVSRILESLARHRLTLRAIVITHAHIDHVGGLATLRNSTGAPVMMHRDDLKLYELLPTQASWLGTKTPARCEVDQFLRESETVRWGAYRSQRRLRIAGLAHARPQRRKREPVSSPRRRTENRGAGFALRRRHTIRRQHRSNRFVVRLDGSNYGIIARQAARIARRHDRIPRSWSHYNHRRGTRNESIPAAIAIARPARFRI